MGEAVIKTLYNPIGLLFYKGSSRTLAYFAILILTLNRKSISIANSLRSAQVVLPEPDLPITTALPLCPIIFISSSLSFNLKLGRLESNSTN